MDRELMDYLPSVMREIQELQYLMRAEQPEAERFWTGLADALADQFVPTALETGVIRWEKILKISPKATDTLEERKFRITARMTEKLPYTWRRLEEQLKLICGADGFSLELTGEFLVTIKVGLKSKRNYETAKEMVERVLPSNLVLDISVLYNQHKTIHGYTHRRLHERTQNQIRNEVLS